jgi:hypothetical protein
MGTVEAKGKPTKADIKETLSLLRDFCIPIASIPDAPTRNALVIWRTSVIKQYLDERFA